MPHQNGIASYMKYLIKECYEEDYDPYYAETWRDNYCYEYTFAEWYFLYRKIKLNQSRRQQSNYKYTQFILTIGPDIYVR